ncbi:hypothetical protein DPMN_040446 [Dreissena polymorpha]|uniref:protein-serine/threonine phosphatase n=1 Tax=Dreissena polymorpha TaxID=45954 RepID=A0A9D4CWX1_DREPO|nr:hypothetical protein DPMN_040446 [Dreissena polymorpha]
MGVYLSSPITDKVSVDEKCSNYVYGASSMQGWRMTQEDAHNCISDFDPETKTSMFAVYDGHGGSEVAQYAAAHFPEFLRTLELYREGQLDEALQKAFLGFDLTLKDEKVIQALKVLAGVDENDEDVVEDEEGMGRSERDLVVAEANMPLEELMARYSGAAALPQKARLMAKDKHPSPMLRPKQSTSNADSNNSAADPLATNLANRLDSEQPDNDNNLNVEKELREAKVKSDSEPDSTNTEQNKNNSNKDCSDSKHSKISNGETNECMEAEDSKIVRSAKSNTDNHDKAGSSTEPDSSSDVLTVQKPLSSEADQGCSSSSSARPGQTSGLGEGQTGEVEGPSGSRSSSIDKPKGEEDWEDYDSEDDDDSDDDDSDDEEDYVEEDDSEDDDDDDDDEEAEEIGGIFGVRSVSDGEEEHSEEPGSDSGCTAPTRATPGKAVDLSFDHKPEDDRERSRIEAAGGKVTNDGRDNGGLNLSRALGSWIL